MTSAFPTRVLWKARFSRKGPSLGAYTKWNARFFSDSGS